MDYQKKENLGDNITFTVSPKNKENRTTVVIVSPSLDPKLNVGGVSSVVSFIIKNNKNVQYIHFQQGKTDTEHGGEFVRLKRILQSYLSWKQLLKKNKKALIHYNTSMDTKSVLRDVFFIRYAYRHHRRIVIHIHGGKYLFEENRPWLIDKILHNIFNLKLPVIVLSNEEKMVIQKDFQCEEIHVMPNVVDLTESSRFSREENIKKQIDILFIGRITEAKGLDFILNACKIIKDEGISFLLHFAGKEQGDKNYISQLTSALGSSFRYEGVVYGKAKYELLKKCEIFLLPSFFEGLPMSLLEAMSFAEVPIVTNVGSINTVVKDKYNGLFVKVKDTPSIVEALKLLISNQDFMKELSANARLTIFEKYNPTTYINRINDIYTKILKAQES